MSATNKICVGGRIRMGQSKEQK